MVEGAYIQASAGVRRRKVKHDANGNLLNHSPDTYKIPAFGDMPEDFRVQLPQGYPNPVPSDVAKAEAEPPFMLAFATGLAIKDAVSSVGHHRQNRNSAYRRPTRLSCFPLKTSAGRAVSRIDGEA